jgi:RimJ/RimL family protein N-acetyltransferase
VDRASVIDDTDAMLLPHAEYSTFFASDGVVALRAWSEVDAAFIVEACTDPAIQRYSASHDHTGRPDPPPTITDARAAIDDFAENWQETAVTGTLTSVGFAITRADSGKAVGQCGIDEWASDGVAQIGYWLAPDSRGHGYATRAVVLLANWLFDNGAARVFMTIVAGNDASVGVARRAGFAYEGTMRAHGIWHDERYDVMWFAALRNEWGRVEPHGRAES